MEYTIQPTSHGNVQIGSAVSEGRRKANKLHQLPWWGQS